ncbi:MAG: hypothetical protein SFV19_11070 [Rhodospirillaceae bacterium]|nr:hypothetical protein [Rhodospirillaceae bacterium]
MTKLNQPTRILGRSDVTNKKLKRRSRRIRLAGARKATREGVFTKIKNRDEVAVAANPAS